MNNYFIILAAGSSKRFNTKKPKQYFFYRNKEIFEHSIQKAVNSKLFKKIILVLDDPKKIQKRYSKNILVIKGGKERSDSSLIALKKIKKYNPTNVLIHDAARPDFSIKLIKNLIKNLKNNIAVIPVIFSKDSIKYKIKNEFYNLNRNNSFLTQTPQAFRYKDLYSLAKNQSRKIQDESTLFIQKDLKIKFIKGENSNYKITYQKDINSKKMNYGIGFDVHRLVPNRKLYLGGLKIKSKLGTLGHSDGDPVLHAITDSILGACRKGDIGQKFSDQDIKFKNIRSTILLSKVIKEIEKKKFFINNLDINIITQAPKISKYKKKMISMISKLCKIKKNQINIKGKTAEKLGVIGKEKAIACEVITSVYKYE